MRCPRCNTDHPKCAAHRRDGQPCRAWPVTGADKCRMHAGRRTADVKAHHAAQQAVATLGLPVDVDPHGALLEEVHRTAGHVRWLGQIVADIEQGDLVWGVTEHKSGFNSGTTEAAGPNVWLKLYQQERKHLESVCKTAIAAGIAERRVQLEKEQGEAVVEVIRATLDDLGVDVTPEVASTVAGHLRVIDGGQAA